MQNTKLSSFTQPANDWRTEAMQSFFFWGSLPFLLDMKINGQVIPCLPTLLLLYANEKRLIDLRRRGKASCISWPNASNFRVPSMETILLAAKSFKLRASIFLFLISERGAGEENSNPQKMARSMQKRGAWKKEKLSPIPFQSSQALTMMFRSNYLFRRDSCPTRTETWIK